MQDGGSLTQCLKIPNENGKKRNSGKKQYLNRSWINSFLNRVPILKFRKLAYPKQNEYVGIHIDIPYSRATEDRRQKENLIPVQKKKKST